jgi:hypothetical protein
MAGGEGRKKGDKIADLAFFDDSLVLGDNDGTTIRIVEFRYSSRDDLPLGESRRLSLEHVADILHRCCHDR